MKRAAGWRPGRADARLEDLGARGGAVPAGAPAPAYYARGTTRWRAWWSLLHPPYTLMHLSFVVVGAALAPVLHWDRLAWTLLAFFLAMGLGAHALDELRGRPLATRIPGGVLVALAVVALAGAAAVGVWGLLHYGVAPGLFFVPLGVFLVVAYNLELFDARLHNDLVFALAWGAFPGLVAFYAQTGTVTLVALFGALYALAASHLQRVLSTEARHLRRRVRAVSGTMTRADGAAERIDRARLLAAPETALRVLVVVSLVVAAMLMVRHGP